MTITRTSATARAHDHFEPDESLDPQAARRRRGQLEQIDYIAYAANREILSGTVGETDAQAFQKLAVAAARARAQWVLAALQAADAGHPPSAQQIDELIAMRRSFEEMSEAYEAMRRMIERGYLAFTAGA